MKFFGGGAKKEEKKPQQQAAPPTNPGGMTPDQVKQQQALVSLTKELAASKERIDQQYEKIEKQETKIKELIAKGKRTEAKRQLMTFKNLQAQLEQQENLITTLEKTKVQLEASLSTKSMIDVLAKANEIQKQLDSNRDQIEDVLMDRKELEQDQKEISNLISELANGTEEEKEELDDLFKQYEKQVFEEKAMSINTNPVNVNVNTTVQKNKEPAYQQIQKQPQKVEDPLDDILQQSAQYS